MRSVASDYELVAPPTLDETLALLASAPGAWRPFAGGTDLMVLLEAGNLRHRRFVSIAHHGELRRIDLAEDHVAIGALATYTDIRRHAPLVREFPLLARAAAETGGIAIQNRGTIGGNIANASPAADTPPALLVYDAELELVSAHGSRRVKYADFHRGYKVMDLRPDELIARIRLPRGATAGGRHYYRKVGTRRAQAITKVLLAGLIRADGKVRLALGAVAPVPLRARKTEVALAGGAPLDAPETIARARAALDGEIAPIDDLRSTAAYRRRVAGNLLEDFLRGGTSH